MKLSGTIQNVTRATLGSQLAADAFIGDSTVTVVDGSDFNEDDGTGAGGGTLSIGGSQVDYTAIDQATNIVTLATTLTVNASQGDQVDVWDLGTGSAASDTVAYVALAGGNANDDFVQASVAHALALTLPLGIRNPGTGEACTLDELEPGDAEWVVIDVRGKKPAIVGGVGALMQKVYVASFGTAHDPIPWVAYGPYEFGPAADFVSLGGGVVSLLKTGWYDVSIRADLHSVTAGVGVSMYLALSAEPVGPLVPSWDIGGGQHTCYICTGPFYFDLATDDPVIYSGINAADGSGVLTSAVIKIDAEAGVTP